MTAGILNRDNKQNSFVVGTIYVICQMNVREDLWYICKIKSSALLPLVGK